MHYAQSAKENSIHNNNENLIPLSEAGYMDHMIHIKDTAIFTLAAIGLTQPSSFTREFFSYRLNHGVSRHVQMAKNYITNLRIRESSSG